MNVPKFRPPTIIELSEPWSLAYLVLIKADEVINSDYEVMETVITRSALDDLSRCARDLGIFGFDLCEEKTIDNGRRFAPLGKPDKVAELKVDFAVGDEETKSTLHLVLETVHPESISIFRFDQGIPQRFMGRRSGLEGRARRICFCYV